MSRLSVCGAILFGLNVGCALAATVPMDESSFTAYVQKRLQLYAAEPIAITGPFTLAVGAAGNTRNLPSLVPLHDSCVSDAAKCEGAADAFVQNVVHDELQKPPTESAAAPGTTTLVACNHSTHTLALASFLSGMSDSDSGIANSGGDAKWCVRHAGNWDIQARTLQETCSGAVAESASFKTFHATGKPLLVWNLGS